MKLSPREAQALIFIRKTMAKHGRAPFQYEIAAHLGTRSRGFVGRLLSNLVGKGFIRRDKFKPAGIQLVEGWPSQVRLNSEISRLVADYAKQQGTSKDTIVNAALRDWFGAAA